MGYKTKKEPEEIKRNFTMEEKTIIALNVDNYDTFICKVHGVYQIRKRSKIHGCPYCKEEGQSIPEEKMKELHEQFRKELQWD